MSKGKCQKSECTVAETGICLLNNDPNKCPHFIDEKNEVITQPLVRKSPDDAISPAKRRFHSGIELGTQDASEIMRSRYAHLIGILGPYNVGKTCFLASLYLLASCGNLGSDYIFAGSLTLQAFEDRVRNVRKWNRSHLPDQIVEHTHLSDDRNPALMHLALRETKGQRRHLDLLLTDLPGEWSKDLIDRAATAHRFKFLHRSDGIIFMVDGPLLASNESRHTELMRAQLLLERLLKDVKIERTIPLIFFISKCDTLDMQIPKGIQELKDYAENLGLKPSIVSGAAFSSKPSKFKNGKGVMESIKIIVEKESLPQPAQRTSPIFNELRIFQRFQM